MAASVETTARERPEALIGTWTMRAGPPDGPPWPGNAWVRFEWLDGAPLLIERWRVDMPEAPDGTAVIGCDGMIGSYYQLYTDERDVQRIHAMSLDGTTWRLWRDGPPFAQRFTGHFSEDSRTIHGRWEIAEAGEPFRVDFDVTYAKAEDE